MKIKFTDIYGTEVNLSISNSGYIRIDVEGEDWQKRKHPTTGEKIPNCISMTENQASILVNGINDLLERLDS